MVDINQRTVEALISNKDAPYYTSVQSDINVLIDYANHVTTMEEKLKAYPKNSGMYSFMAKQLDEQRREKHDRALYCLNHLNEVAEDNGFDPVYSGDLQEETARNDAADAIYEFCKYYLTR